MMTNTCQLCGSEHRITFHHLILKSCHSNKWFKKRFSKEEMLHRGIQVCRPCHSFIHKQFSEKELGRDLNTLELLLEQEVIQKHIHWAKKQY